MRIYKNQQKIFVSFDPAGWYAVVRLALKQNTKYRGVQIDQEQFYDSKVMKTQIIKNKKVDVDNNHINGLIITWLQ